MQESHWSNTLIQHLLSLVTKLNNPSYLNWQAPNQISIVSINFGEMNSGTVDIHIAKISS